jgi:drug/metabolite transporter (DMT)-like permease
MIEADPRARRRRAIYCVLAASAIFTLGAAFVKTLTTSVPVFEIVMVRGWVAFLALTPVLWREGGWRAMRTRRPMGHILRTGLGFFGTFTTVYGFSYLPIVTVTALGFAMPLFLTVLAVPFLGERVGWRRASAVVVGLLGVMLMLRPWDAADAQHDLFATLLVIAGVVTWALAMITIRKLGEAGERNVTIVAWFTCGTAALATLCALPNWVTPTPTEWAMLLAAGVMSGIAQLLMTEGYRAGDTTVVAPFEYGAIVYATILGVALWGDYPDAFDWAGVAILVAAGLYIWRREVVLGVRR